MLIGQPQAPYSILNDPDNGIRLPGEQNQAERRTHIAIETIISQLHKGAQCVITFDQSVYRNSALKPDEQRQAKMHRLYDEGFHSFYYVPHAPFLFAVPNIVAFQRIQEILRAAGIPKERFENHRQQAE